MGRPRSPVQQVSALTHIRPAACMIDLWNSLANLFHCRRADATETAQDPDRKSFSSLDTGNAHGRCGFEGKFYNCDEEKTFNKERQGANGGQTFRRPYIKAVRAPPKNC